MKDIKMLMLAEELQPILTRATVMPESRWSAYHLLLQHHYQVYSVDNKRYEKFCIVQHILYIISYIQMKHCLCGAAPIGFSSIKNTSQCCRDRDQLRNIRQSHSPIKLRRSLCWCFLYFVVLCRLCVIALNVL
jgi:hypothetical protein